MKDTRTAMYFGFVMSFAGFAAERFCRAQKNSADKSIFPGEGGGRFAA